MRAGTKRLAVLALGLSLLLSGCSLTGNRVLERSYSSSAPHSATYWEDADRDTLRIESYQDLVNALLLLALEHAPEATVRFYDREADAYATARRACSEVQQETDVGAFLLDYIVFSVKEEHDYAELSVSFSYRRSAEEQAAILNATSTEALPDLLRAAAAEDLARIAIRVGYFATDRVGVLDMVRAVYEELYPVEEPPADEPPAEGGEIAETGGTAEEKPPTDEAPAGESPEEPSETEEPAPREIPWQTYFYPDNDHPGIVEVILREEPEE